MLNDPKEGVFAGELVPASITGGGPLAKDEDFDSVLASSTFLPRLQVFGASSNICTEQGFPIGHLGLVKAKDDVEDLGTSVDCLPLAWRFKAMQISGDDVVTYYNHEHAEFKRIQDLSGDSDSGCMWGAEFLVWLPEAGAFATFFLGSKSARRESKPMRALIGKAATVEAKLIKTKKYSWHAPKVAACSTPFDVPEQEPMVAEIDRFRNAKDSEAESLTEEDEAATTRSR